MDYGQARIVARYKFDEIERENPNYRGVLIQDEHTIDHPKAWVFVFETREYLENGSTEGMHFPNVYVVPKDGTEARFPPTSIDIFEYLETL